jgi:hypothetical protein
MRKNPRAASGVILTALSLALVTGCSASGLGGAQPDMEGAGQEAVDAARDDVGSVLDRARSQVEEGVQSTLDCADIAQGLSDVDFNANPEQLDQEVADLRSTAERLDSEEIQQSLNDVLSRLQSYAEQVDAGEAADQALNDLRESAQQLGDDCNVPVEELIPSGS